MAGEQTPTVSYYDCVASSDKSEATLIAPTDTTATFSVYVSICSNCTGVAGAQDSTSGTGGTYRVPVRTILVDSPADWQEEDNLAFARLLNAETRTGWLVTMIIMGPIIITDPHVEHRTMREFLPLLRSYANQTDRARIDRFFTEHPL